eukprot:5153742-Amphidinium_carterae.1
MGTQAARALLLLIEVEEVDVNLVLEVLAGVDVELTEVQVNTVGDMEARVLDVVLPGDLKRPMLGSVFDDVDDIVAMRVVDVELNVEVEHLGNVEDRLSMWSSS